MVWWYIDGLLVDGLLTAILNIVISYEVNRRKFDMVIVKFVFLFIFLIY